MWGIRETLPARTNPVKVSLAGAIEIATPHSAMAMTTPNTTPILAGPQRKPYDEEIDVYGLTHPGKVRKENQDHFLICAL